MRHVSVQATVSFIIAFRESRFIDIISTVTSTPSQRGTSRTYTLRRLKRDRRPDAAEQVHSAHHGDGASNHAGRK
jgi:hypothetical protein